MAWPSRVDKLCEEAKDRAWRYFPSELRNDTFVYFCTDGDYVKIGVARDIEARIKGIQTGNPKPVKLIEYLQFHNAKEANIAEKMLHDMFKEDRMCGEWFDVADDYYFLRFIQLIRHGRYDEKFLEQYNKFMKAHWTPEHEEMREMGY